MDLSPAILLVGALTFPSAVVALNFRHEVSGHKFLRTLWRTRAASGYNVEVTNLYTALIFGPNIIGVLATVITQLGLVTGLPGHLVNELQIYHLTLLVLASVGNGLTRTGGQRVLPLFLGEVVSSWAFLSGSMLFVFYLLLAHNAAGTVPTIVMCGVIVVFVVTAIAFMIEKSAGTYLNLAAATDDG